MDSNRTLRQNGNSNPVGTEQLDFKNVCGSKCKWSDVAWYHFVPNRSGGLALIARTQDSLGNLGAGSRLLDHIPGPNVFDVDGKLSNPIINEIVMKVGNKTGWSSGPVKRTCVDISRFGFTFKCQDQADYVRASGDSGGPVFIRVGGPAVVRIVGVHNGVFGSPAYASFSAIANMEVDVGTPGVANLFVGPALF